MRYLGHISAEIRAALPLFEPYVELVTEQLVHQKHGIPSDYRYAVASGCRMCEFRT